MNILSYLGLTMNDLKDTIRVILKLFNVKHWDVEVNHLFAKSGYSITFYRTIDIPGDVFHNKDPEIAAMRHLQPFIEELRKLDNS